MSNITNVENLKKIIKVAALLGNIGGKVFEDGKITISDINVLPDFISIFSTLVEIKWNDISVEAKDFTPDEAQELIATFNLYFDLPQENVERTIEAVLLIVGQLVSTIINLIQVFKRPTIV